MSVVSAVEKESTEPDDEPLVEPLAAPIEGAPHKYLIAFAVVLAALMQVIDSSIVNVALPDMMGNLGASLDEIAWVSTGYILANSTIPYAGAVKKAMKVADSATARQGRMVDTTPETP